LCRVLFRTTFSGMYLCNACIYLVLRSSSPIPSLTERKSLQPTFILFVLSSLSLELLSSLHRLNSLSACASKYGLTTIGTWTWVTVLASWLYVSYICVVFIFNFELRKLMCDRNVMQVNLFVSGAENMERKQVV